jgi:hypothetical protein
MALVTVQQLKDTLGIGNLYADEVLEQIIDTVTDVIEGVVTATSFDAEPPAMKEAALILCVDLFQTQNSAAGQQVSVDFQSPSPFRAGRSFTQKVIGLLGKYVDEGVLVG